MKIEVDLDLCQGHAVCAAEAPTVFEVPKRGKVELLQPTPSENDLSDVRAAIQYCPTRALRLTGEGDRGDPR